MFDTLRNKLKSFFSAETEKKPKSSKPKKQKKSSRTKESKKQEKPEIEEKLKEISDSIEHEVPLKFKVGELKYEPDEKAIKEIHSPQEKPEGKKSFFLKLKESFSIRHSKISKKQVEEIFINLELILLENNVALEVVDKIKSSLLSALVNKEVKKSELQNLVIKSLKESISSVLQNPPNILDLINAKKEPYVILFFGINGSGKTTSLAKLSYYLKQNNISSLLAAGDTFRAASIEQLETHASCINVPIIKSQYGADPASVAFDAINYAKKHRIKAVLIDTAGRMYTKENLMKEMEKIVRISKPDLKIFVGEAIAGNDATQQARTFNESVGIDGIILTKADVDDKGGTALSVSQVTGKPIFFLGTGQDYGDFKIFNKQEVIDSLGLA